VLCRAQVVGWPPIRSYRKNTMATTQQKGSKEDAEAKQGQGFLYVKVSMDGAPYLRKVDIKMYSSYEDLSAALEKMFSCFITGESCAALSFSLMRFPSFGNATTTPVTAVLGSVLIGSVAGRTLCCRFTQKVYCTSFSVNKKILLSTNKDPLGLLTLAFNRHTVIY